MKGICASGQVQTKVGQDSMQGRARLGGTWRGRLGQGKVNGRQGRKAVRAGCTEEMAKGEGSQECRGADEQQTDGIECTE